MSALRAVQPLMLMKGTNWTLIHIFLMLVDHIDFKELFRLMRTVTQYLTLHGFMHFIDCTDDLLATR